MRVLIVEDDTRVSGYIAKGLSELGHTAEQAENGRDGLFMATTENFDAIVLDRMLPVTDGMKILKVLRASDIHTPVLILSALGEVDNRIEGLKAGGDDYLVKPFEFSELMARLEVIVKRHNPLQQQSTTLAAGRLSMDLVARKVMKDGEKIDLQPREFRVLEFLMRHREQLVTRTMLLEQVWDYHFDPETNVIDVHISKLRTKLDDKTQSRSFIETIRGSGYILRDL